MLMRKILCIVLVLALFWGIQCTSDKAPKPETNNQSKQKCAEKPGFQKSIKPVFTNTCATAGCHGSATAAGGYVLKEYKDIKDAVLNGKVLCAIKHESGCSDMPKNSDKLADSTICAIEQWAENGAPDN